jgi:hypothetical protein
MTVLDGRMFDVAQFPVSTPTPALTVIPDAIWRAKNIRSLMARRQPPPKATRVNPRTGKAEAVAAVDNDMQKQAELIAAGLLDPQVAAINRAIAAKERQELARGEAFKGVSEALARYTAGIPAGIQAAYQGAADRTAGYAGGMTGALSDAAANAAREAGQTIANIGPTGGPGVTSEGGAIANVTNYLGGFLPASNLAQEAASRLAEASTMRAAGGARLAEEALASMRATREETEELRMRGLDLENTRPAEIQKALAQLRSEDREERQLKLQERAFAVQLGELQLARAKTANDRAEALTNLTGYVHIVKNGKVVRTKEIASGSRAFTEAQEQENQNARTAAQIAAANKRKAAELAAKRAQDKIENTFRQAGLDISEENLKIAADREARLAKGNPKKGGFTAKMKAEFVGTANTFIQKAIEKNKTPSEYIRQVIGPGKVPFSIAIRTLKNLVARARKQKNHPLRKSPYWDEWQWAADHWSK